MKDVLTKGVKARLAPWPTGKERGGLGEEGMALSGMEELEMMAAALAFLDAPGMR